MEARYRIDETDYLRAQQLFSRPTRGQRIAIAVMGVALLGLAIGATGIAQGGAIGALVGAALFTFVGRFLITPIVSRRSFARHKTLQDEFRIAVGEDGLTFTATNGHQLLKWDQVLKWRQDAHMLLVFQAPRLFHPIPKRIESPKFSMDRLTALLKEHVGDGI